MTYWPKVRAIYCREPQRAFCGNFRTVNILVSSRLMVGEDDRDIRRRNVPPRSLGTTSTPPPFEQLLPPTHVVTLHENERGLCENLALRSRPCLFLVGFQAGRNLISSDVSWMISLSMNYSPEDRLAVSTTRVNVLALAARRSFSPAWMHLSSASWLELTHLPVSFAEFFTWTTLLINLKIDYWINVEI